MTNSLDVGYMLKQAALPGAGLFGKLMGKAKAPATAVVNKAPAVLSHPPAAVPNRLISQPLPSAAASEMPTGAIGAPKLTDELGSAARQMNEARLKAAPNNEVIEGLMNNSAIRSRYNPSSTTLPSAGNNPPALPSGNSNTGNMEEFWSLRDKLRAEKLPGMENERRLWARKYAPSMPGTKPIQPPPSLPNDTSSFGGGIASSPQPMQPTKSFLGPLGREESFAPGSTRLSTSSLLPPPTALPTPPPSNTLRNIGLGGLGAAGAASGYGMYNALKK